MIQKGGDEEGRREMKKNQRKTDGMVNKRWT
jgi:hypothetical protein